MHILDNTYEKYKCIQSKSIAIILYLSYKKLHITAYVLFAILITRINFQSHGLDEIFFQQLLNKLSVLLAVSLL